MGPVAVHSRRPSRTITVILRQKVSNIKRSGRREAPEPRRPSDFVIPIVFNGMLGAFNL